jgi:transposase-like protein
MSRPDFPRSLPEFFKMFPDEVDCLRFVVESRWPDGNPVCPKCGHDGAYPRNDRPGGLRCASCDYIFSVTVGTVMENTKLPLSTWLQAAYLMVTDKRGVSAKQLQRDLGLKGYETAWSILQKLRSAMVAPEREKLTGRVEVDESFLGGPEPGKRGRGAEGKYQIVGAVEVRSGDKGTYPARVRFRHIDNAIQPVLVDFVLETVADGATVVTDDFSAYDILPQFGFPHKVESTARGLKPDAVLKHYHLAVSNLKTWLHGTFHGAVGRAPKDGIGGKHLQGYLNEYAFRFNRRHNLYAAFQTVLGLAGRVQGPTQDALYAMGSERFRHVNDPGSGYRARGRR